MAEILTTGLTPPKVEVPYLAGFLVDRFGKEKMTEIFNDTIDTAESCSTTTSSEAGASTSISVVCTYRVLPV